jgi:predicted CopG family antitoxin
MNNIGSTISTQFKRCTVLLKQDVYKRLKKRGRFGKSFSDVVARLIDESEEANRGNGLQ